MQHIRGDFNFSTVIRNANAFAAKEVFYIGKKKFDRRGAVGTYLYTKVRFLSDSESLVRLKDEYLFVGVDNIEGSVLIETFVWPDKPILLLFGEEGGGLTSEVIRLCDVIVAINQYGSVRSLNVGTASGIVMYEYVKNYVSSYSK